MRNRETELDSCYWRAMIECDIVIDRDGTLVKSRHTDNDESFTRAIKENLNNSKEVLAVIPISYLQRILEEKDKLDRKINQIKNTIDGK